MKSQNNQVRIIAGKWRGRKISFPDIESLRPTTDQIRETLFNWLMPDINGASCLDLFAGSGALGFEAASRGASQVDMVESSRTAFEVLNYNKSLLEAANIQLYFQDALSYLHSTKNTFDIVFLDPPFKSSLLPQICDLLIENPCIRPGGLVYLELPVDKEVNDLSVTWEILKEKQSGQVKYMLAKLSVLK